jgi:single-strand DNA-binding protein
MATNLNNVTVVGNITRDPEMRFTANGRSTTNFGLAVNRSWRNQQTNEWEERTSFFNVVSWGNLADNVGSSLKKGMRVLVTGRLEQRSWETEQGDKRSVVEIVADEVGPSLLFATAEVHRIERSGPDGGGQGGGGQQRRQPAPANAGNAGANAGSGGGDNASYDDYGEEPF